MRQFAVIGLGQFGMNLALTLYKLGQEVLCIDKDIKKVDNISPMVTRAIQLDVSEEKDIKRLELNNSEAVIIAFSEDIYSSILTTMICKESGVKRVFAKAQDELHAKLLTHIGVEKVLFPEHDIVYQFARQLISGNNILEMIELSMGYTVMEVQSAASWAGKTLSDLKLRKKWGINVLAIKTGDKINAEPGADDKIEVNDTLIIFGSNKNINNLKDFK